MAETCPKCGYAQVETDECPRCRVVLSKYRAYLQTLGEKPAAPAPPPSSAAAPPPLPVEGGVWPEGSPAGFWVRGAALVVDGLVMGAVLLPFVIFIVFPMLVAGGLGRPDPAYIFAVVWAYAVVALVVQAGYMVWMHGKWGQTVGKMATGVKVIQVGGAPIGYGRALVRFLFPFLLGYTPSLATLLRTSAIIQIPVSILSFIVAGLNYVIAGFRSDKRAIHDLIAGTRVMKVRRPRLEGRPSGFWMRFAASVVDWAVLGVVIGVPFWTVALISGLVAMLGRRQEAAVAAVLLTFGIFYVGFTIAYSIWMHGQWGQTLGKRALGMKVVQVDGAALGYGRAGLRWLVSVLWAVVLGIGQALADLLSEGRVQAGAAGVALLIFLVGYIMAGVRSDKRSLHDLVAGSRVTYIR